VVIADLPAVLEDDIVLGGVDGLAADVVRMRGVHVEREFGRDDVVGFGTLLLLVHLPDSGHLVDALVEHHHGLVLAVGHLSKS
jgi:hypothetical protein